MKSSSLLQEQYAPVLEVLNHAAVFSRGETHEDQLAQILVDIQEAEDEDSEEEDDLMTSDDEEDEEEIELENEEDRAIYR